MRKSFGFIDESGLIEVNEPQRFFGIGLLSVENCFPLNQKTHRIFQAFRNHHGKKTEMKFNLITSNDCPFYISLINTLRDERDFYFSACVIDTKDPNYKGAKYFSSTWDAYIAWTKMLLRNCLKKDEEIAIITDYLNKPKDSNRKFEYIKQDIPLVFNICQAESESHLLLMLVDVLLGGVLFERKLREGLVSHSGKTKVSQEIMKLIKGNSKFDVWDIDWKKSKLLK